MIRIVLKSHGKMQLNTYTASWTLFRWKNLKSTIDYVSLKNLEQMELHSQNQTIGKLATQILREFITENLENKTIILKVSDVHGIVRRRTANISSTARSFPRDVVSCSHLIRIMQMWTQPRITKCNGGHRDTACSSLDDQSTSGEVSSFFQFPARARVARGELRLPANYRRRTGRVAAQRNDDCISRRQRVTTNWPGHRDLCWTTSRNACDTLKKATSR